MSHRVCLIGSSKFSGTFYTLAHKLEQAGSLALHESFPPPSRYPQSGVLTPGKGSDFGKELTQERLSLCSEVLVINGLWARCPTCQTWKEKHCTHVGDHWHDLCNCHKDWPPLQVIPCELATYIGQGTRAALDHALALSKPVLELLGMDKKCQHCEAAAVAIFRLPQGCAVFPDVLCQALCTHHALKASPSGGIILELDMTLGKEFTKLWTGPKT